MNCPSCQKVNAEGARFCSNCGAALAVARPAEGERKFVTVLFADVVGSTAMGEELDPEQIIEVMNGAFAFMNAAVARYGGTVARLMGDAILAFFGAPVAHEDDAERAVRAGLEIQAAAADYAGQIERRFGLDFRVRVGVNTGLVVLAMVGDEIKTEYTAMGDTTNVAARLQSAAEPGSVLVSAVTQHLTRTTFDFNPRGALEVKGRSAAVRAFEVLGPKATPGRARGLEGIASPLVGRDAELGRLREQLDALRAGRGGLVAVTGEAGLGKSRLIAELRSQAIADSGGVSASADTPPESAIAWLEGRSLTYGQGLTYYPWQEILRAAIGAGAEDAPEVVREKLGQACDAWGVAEDDRPFLEALLAVESESSAQALAAVGEDALPQRIASATRAFLRGLAGAAGRPTVVVFDDLHWADTASLDLLGNVADLVAEQPLLLLALMRPDKSAPGWTALAQAREKLGARFTEIALEPLSGEKAQELLGNLLYIEELPEGVRALMLRKSEGNPFFLEEVIRSLIDSGHIVREEGHWRATRDIQNVAIPDTLAGVLSARLDRLPEETKRVTQTAAVIGRLFARRVLTAVFPPDERIDALEAHLSRLTYEELVRERARDPELEYIFKHALTQEAAYESLLIRRRKQLHGRTGTVLEELYPERLDELAPALAHHFWQGEDWARAVAFSLRAGARARRMYALAEALEHYDRACTALEKDPEASAESRIDAILSWTWVAYKLQRHEEMRQRLARAEALARELGDKARLAEVLGWIANVHLLTGFPSRAMPALMESQQLAEEVGDDRLALLPLFMTTMGMVDQDPRGALLTVDEVITLARTHASPEVEAHALGMKAMANARLGNYSEAQAAIDAALAIVPKVASPVKEADVHITVGAAYFDMGEVARGLEHTRYGAEVALSAKGMECAYHGYSFTGFGNLQLPDVPEAVKAFQESVNLTDFMGIEELKNVVRAGLAMAQLAGDDREGLRELEEALANARALGDAYHSAFFAETLGAAYTRLGDLDRAESHLNAALKFYRYNQMRPYIARALRSLADLNAAQGRAAEADQARAEAQRLEEELAAPVRSAP
jgi:class 3 adenylate cyclase/tetratricopeptide (TPR) repeat protein